MQEPARILSQEQKTCLESVYTFLQGSTVYLRAVAHVVYPEDEGTPRSRFAVPEPVA